jgi:hypothetical protein
MKGDRDLLSLSSVKDGIITKSAPTWPCLSEGKGENKKVNDIKKRPSL